MIITEVKSYDLDNYNCDILLIPTCFSQISNLVNGNTNPMNLISTILSNKDGLSNILKLFKGGGLNLLNKSRL